MKVLLNDGRMIEAGFDDLEGKKAFWHTSAHVLAHAVKRLYPSAKCAMGSVIENGFYSDFDFGFSFSEENLTAIEAEMKAIVQESLSLQVYALGKEEAPAFMKERGEDSQLERIQDLPADENVSFYKQGEYAIKPMSCPGGMLVYKQEPHSYRNLPLRLAELGLIHRNEKSGELHGLMRVRACTQDDAHIFMTREQMIDEIQNVVRLIDTVYTRFGFAYRVELSTQPKDSIGSAEDWTLATEALRNAIDSMGIPYSVNEGDGAFYGPKLDFHLQDSIGRTWQCGTVQLDFQLPQRFEIEYIGADGAKHRPIMIHRAIFGSIERFIGILIEHYAGNFPVWLAPVQVKLLPVSDKYLSYMNAVLEELKAADIRVEIDTRDEKLGYKIREAQLDKVPFMVIVGEKEQANRTVSVRQRDADSNKQDMGEMSIDGLLALLR